MKSGNGQQLRILVAPLDWGLGHTTRCIPVIQELVRLDADVILAGNEIQKSLLLREFPQCRFLNLDGYDISYSKKGRSFAWKILEQTPGLLRTISKENNWLSRTIESEKIDGVISDNRFGLYSKKIPAVFITHQLLIKDGVSTMTERLLQQFNYKYINRFEGCWIPDFDSSLNLAGQLSHPEKTPAIPCEYIGALSRMKSLAADKIPNHILVMLSGPEPQRTIFEELILEQLRSFTGSATVVRGLPATAANLHSTENATIYNHLNKEELNKEMCVAEFIVCRSGYSSVMDIHAAGARSIQVPTPGQTEQEYLAQYLASKSFCITSSQKDFNLNDLIEKARNFDFENNFQQKENSLREAVQKFVDKCWLERTKRNP